MLLSRLRRSHKLGVVSRLHTVGNVSKLSGRLLEVCTRCVVVRPFDHRATKRRIVLELACQKVCNSEADHDIARLVAECRLARLQVRDISFGAT